MSKSTKPKTRKRTDQERAKDDAALRATGEALATLPEIAAQLNVSVKTLRWVIQREGAPLVRYISTTRPVQHCIADARAAVEGARPEIEARQKRAAEIEAAERLRGEQARAANPVVHAAHVPEVIAARSRPFAGGSGGGGAGGGAPAARKKTVPEVVTVRRRSR